MVEQSLCIHVQRLSRKYSNIDHINTCNILYELTFEFCKHYCFRVVTLNIDAFPRESIAARIIKYAFTRLALFKYLKNSLFPILYQYITRSYILIALRQMGLNCFLRLFLVCNRVKIFHAFLTFINFLLFILEILSILMGYSTKK